VRILIPVLILSLAGCSKNIQTKEAVRQGVVNYISKRSDLTMSSMDVEVTNVTFKANEAEAMVSFKPKGADASMGMSMRYTLEQKGNEWVVKGRADSGGMGGHGATAPAPQSNLPPDHPPMGSGMPPGAKK